ncbi:hypothetical protein DYB36_012976, partial [Aphanomyces astaci]
GICACFMSFFSSDGNGNIAECSNAGTCDRSKGECVCDPRFTGASCNRSEMDSKNRPQANTIQVVQCIGTTGTFTLGFRGQTTPALSFSISAASLTVALQALPAFGQVSVVYSSGPAACTASGINSISIMFRTVFGTLPTIRTTVNGVTSVTVKNDGTGGSVVGTKEDAVCSNRGTCDTLHGICICAEGFTSSDGYGGPGSRGDCGYMEPVYLNSAAKVANEIA